MNNKPAIFLAKKALILLKAISTSNAKSNASMVKSLGWDLNDIMISCYYNGIQCSINDFYYWTSFEYGNCYTFNYALNSSSTLKQTSKTGPENGLSMELFTGFSGNLYVII